MYVILIEDVVIVVITTTTTTTTTTTIIIIIIIIAKVELVSLFHPQTSSHLLFGLSGSHLPLG
jgi:hypothetical protein